MWTAEATATTSASSEVIWQLWSDVANWKTWDTQVESSSLDGLFVSGTRGKLKPKGGPASPFVMLDTQPGRSFTDRTRLPGATMDFIHEMTSTPTGTQFTHRIRITGPLSPLFARLMGRNLRQGVQDAVQKLAHLASGVEE
jgi:hypothetical protein